MVSTALVCNYDISRATPDSVCLTQPTCMGVVKQASFPAPLTPLPDLPPDYNGLSVGCDSDTNNPSGGDERLRAGGAPSSSPHRLPRPPHSLSSLRPLPPRPGSLRHRIYQPSVGIPSGPIASLTMFDDYQAEHESKIENAHQTESNVKNSHQTNMENKTQQMSSQVEGGVHSSELSEVRLSDANEAGQEELMRATSDINPKDSLSVNRLTENDDFEDIIDETFMETGMPCETSPLSSVSPPTCDQNRRALESSSSRSSKLSRNPSLRKISQAFSACNRSSGANAPLQGLEVGIMTQTLLLAAKSRQSGPLTLLSSGSRQKRFEVPQGSCISPSFGAPTCAGNLNLCKSVLELGRRLPKAGKSPLFPYRTSQTSHASSSRSSPIPHVNPESPREPRLSTSELSGFMVVGINPTPSTPYESHVEPCPERGCTSMDTPHGCTFPTTPIGGDLRRVKIAHLESTPTYRKTAPQLESLPGYSGKSPYPRVDSLILGTRANSLLGTVTSTRLSAMEGLLMRRRGIPTRESTSGISGSWSNNIVASSNSVIGSSSHSQRPPNVAEYLNPAGGKQT
eukprot:gene23549-9073_t